MICRFSVWWVFCQIINIKNCEMRPLNVFPFCLNHLAIGFRPGIEYSHIDQFFAMFNDLHFTNYKFYYLPVSMLHCPIWFDVCGVASEKEA